MSRDSRAHPSCDSAGPLLAPGPTAEGMISVFAPPREDFLLGGKAMDANKDGRLTPEEIQAFMQGNKAIGSAAVESSRSI
jgi:hypothetical protein